MNTKPLSDQSPVRVCSCALCKLTVCEQSMPHTYPDLYASPDHLSQLTFSDQWFGSHAFTHEVVGSTPDSRVNPIHR